MGKGRARKKSFFSEIYEESLPVFSNFWCFFCYFPPIFYMRCKKKEFEICECSAAFRPIIVGSHCGDAVLSIRPALTPSSEGASSQEWALQCPQFFHMQYIKRSLKYVSAPPANTPVLSLSVDAADYTTRTLFLLRGRFFGTSGAGISYLQFFQSETRQCSQKQLASRDSTFPAGEDKKLC